MPTNLRRVAQFYTVTNTPTLQPHPYCSSSNTVFIAVSMLCLPYLENISLYHNIHRKQAGSLALTLICVTIYKE